VTVRPPTRLVAVWPAQSLVHSSLRVRRKSEQAKGGPQQTCHPEHLCAHTSVKPQALRLTSGPKVRTKALALLDVLDRYACLAAFVAAPVYSGL
jgi:hypothetical protein